jgi:hypothetical protein
MALGEGSVRSVTLWKDIDLSGLEIPERRPFTGPVDPWAQEIMEVFRSVINRPKSGLKAEPFHPVPRVMGICTPITVLGTEEKFNLFIHWNNRHLRVSVNPDNFEVGFNFSAVISRNKPLKVRKLALVMCKKLVNKAVFDVIHS